MDLPELLESSGDDENSKERWNSNLIENIFV